jgi:hypothetical protein
MGQHARLDLAQLLSAAVPLVAAFPGDIWLAHEIIERANGKQDKPPCPGFRTNAPDSWCALAGAIAVAERYPPGAVGVGFAIVENMLTLDFDDCVRPNGEVVEAVAELIERLDSLSYKTISGSGMRVVCRNDPADPVPAGKYSGRVAGGYRLEIFVGPTNHYNTFCAPTNGKPIAARSAVVRELLDELSGSTRGPREANGAGNLGEIGRTSDLGKRARNLDALLSALKAIPLPADSGRKYWVDIGEAMYGATAGSERGREAFFAWSKTWPRFADNPETYGKEVETLWQSFHAAPARTIGAGTIFREAKKHGWKWPKKTTSTAATRGRRYHSFAGVKVRVPQDFIADLLETNTLAMIYGPRSAGKTYLLLDMLLHVAWGQTWFGLEVEPGPALLYPLEGNVDNRVIAFRQQYDLDGVDLPFRWNNDAIDLANDGVVDGLIADIKAWGETFGQKVKVVAIDTLAATLRGSEDGSEAMNPVLANCHRIRRATGCCLLLVHHPGKDAKRGPRGFYGVEASLDTLLEVKRADNGEAQLSVRKQRDLDWRTDLFYRTEKCVISFDLRRPRPIVTNIVVPILEATERATAAARARLAQLSPQHRLALDALRDALEQHGASSPKGQQARKVITMEQWYQVFRQRFPADASEKSVRRAWQRSRQALLEAGLIEAEGKLVWLPTNG